MLGVDVQQSSVVVSHERFPAIQQNFRAKAHPIVIMGRLIMGVGTAVVDRWVVDAPWG